MRKPKLVIGLRQKKSNGENPKDQWGVAKVPFGTVPATLLFFASLAHQNGNGKYGPYNYRVKKVQALTYLEAALRHLALLLDGEDFDRDTGYHHGGFILACIGIYLDAMVNNMLVDNRPLPGRLGELVAAFNLKPGEKRTPDDNRRLLNEILSAETDKTYAITPSGTKAKVLNRRGQKRAPVADSTAGVASSVREET